MGTQGPRGDAFEIGKATGSIPDAVWQYTALAGALVVGFALLSQSPRLRRRGARGVGSGGYDR